MFLFLEITYRRPRTLFIIRLSVCQLSSSSQTIANSILSPDKRWGVDFREMTSHASRNAGIDEGHKFILCCLNHFMRKAWARLMKKQSAHNVTVAIKSIVGKHILHILKLYKRKREQNFYDKQKHGSRRIIL